MRRCFPFLALLLAVPSILFAGSREDLFDAVQRSDRKTILSLVRGGVSINVQDPEGRTPLMTALELGLNSLCRWFVQELGADPDLADNRKETPLMTAVRASNRDGLRLLLRNGADPNRLNTTGESPLSLAINTGKFVLADDLIEAGALLFQERIDLPVLDHIYRTRLKIRDNSRILDTSGTGVDIFALLEQGDYHQLRLYLEKGHSPNVSDSTGLTPLMYAATLKKPHLAELLFRYGADPQARDSLGMCALDYAAYYGRVSVVDYLSSRMEVQPESLPLENNPLFYALIGRQPESFSVLVARGYGNARPDSRGISLVHYICFLGDLQAWRTLDPGPTLILLRDRDGKNPLFWALTGFQLTGGAGEYYALARLLVKGGADGRSLIALTDDPTMGQILTDREQAQPE